MAAGCWKTNSASGQSPDATAGAHSVTITWTASKSKVTGYNVYRASPPGVAVKLSRVVSGTEYTDKTVEPGRSYSYFVTSENLNGLESVPSQRIDVTVPKAGAQAADK